MASWADRNRHALAGRQKAEVPNPEFARCLSEHLRELRVNGTKSAGRFRSCFPARAGLGKPQTDAAYKRGQACTKSGYPMLTSTKEAIRDAISGLDVAAASSLINREAGFDPTLEVCLMTDYELPRGVAVWQDTFRRFRL